ncbi:MAG: right-handed parallel beta-helix repeat-containing protein [Planctomycetes bacterium]|nr:right-handed parallel beta-helix repeat-containing protein [Planctomycetota bacterium]
MNKRYASAAVLVSPVLLALVAGGLLSSGRQGGAAAAAEPAVAAEFFVSPTGQDADPGTVDKPFGTLERARDAVRKLRSADGKQAVRITIWLRAGGYLRTAALELSAADSGTAEAPVVWRAWQDETVRLLGGRTLSGFQPVTDPAVLNRLQEQAREGVRQIDLRALGIHEFSAMKSRGFGRPTTPAHCELFCNGQPMTLARWPNEGEWLQIAGFPETQAQDDGHGGKIGRLEDGFFFAGDRPLGWAATDDLWVHGYWAWDWANSYQRIAALDREHRLIRTASPHGLYGFRKGQRFYFLNVLEELDQPGEWYLDRAAGVLYFWPPNGPGDGAPVAATLSLLDQPLLRLSGTEHVTIQGLTLEATRADAVVMQGGASNRVRGCTIRNIGNWAVRVEGGTGHGVADCDIFDTGDGGVSLSGGDRQTLAPGGHFVENCHFARQGRWSKCYVPAVLMSGVGLRAAHNLIHDHPHCAILFGGNDHVIEFNEIHHIALETGDVGAIYTGRDWTYRGNRIRHNFIHHTGGVGMGSMGVYMDDCVSGTEVVGNVFYKVHWAMFIGGGRDHRVENNVFVDCDPAVRMDGRGLDRSPVWFNMVYDTMKKNLAAVPRDLYRQRYPVIADLDRYYEKTGGVPPENNVVARNVCVGKWLEVGWHAKEEMLKLEQNYVGPDPGFAAPDTMDFRIKADSPVWATGFQPIPWDKIGLQTRRAPQPGP